MGTIRIVSHSDEPFRSRQEAGQMLGAQLQELKGKGAVVLGIPRGGIIVAQALAASIDADLDVILARKLRTPGHEELAMGSIAEDGKVFLNEELVKELGITESEIQEEKATQLEEIARRSRLVRQVYPRFSLAGKTVIVTDDGVATGATFQAALWSARHEKPEQLIAAVPVAAAGAIRRLAPDADLFLCLRLPVYFAAVGQFYRQFDQVEDSEVLQALKEVRARRVS